MKDYVMSIRQKMAERVAGGSKEDLVKFHSKWQCGTEAVLDETLNRAVADLVGKNSDGLCKESILVCKLRQARALSLQYHCLMDEIAAIDGAAPVPLTNPDGTPLIELRDGSR